LLRVAISQTYVNGLSITPGAAGTGVTLTATGEANSDLRLSTSGTGTIDIRNPQVTGSAGSQFGFLTIKVSGTTYKLPIYNPA
jgi:hypothetical protein